MRLTRLAHYGFPLLGLLLFSLSVWAIGQELRQYSYQDILTSLHKVSVHHLPLALLFVALNYWVMTGYDLLACRYIRHPLSYARIALVTLTSYAISNSVGFALLTGSAIRYRLYTRWGFSTVEITQIIAFSNLSFWLGLAAAGSLLFLLEPLGIPALLHLPFHSVHPIGVLCLSLVIAYLLASLGLTRSLRIESRSFSFPTLNLALAQIFVASLDWSLAAAALYVLLPTSTPSYPVFFSIYLLGQLAGLISHVPGGLGVFETVILLLLSPTVPGARIFAALVIYRLLYYIFPLIIAVIGLGIYELQQRKRIAPEEIR